MSRALLNLLTYGGVLSWAWWAYRARRLATKRKHALAEAEQLRDEAHAEVLRGRMYRLYRERQALVTADPKAVGPEAPV